MVQAGFHPVMDSLPGMLYLTTATPDYPVGGSTAPGVMRTFTCMLHDTVRQRVYKSIRINNLIICLHACISCTAVTLFTPSLLLVYSTSSSLNLYTVDSCYSYIYKASFSIQTYTAGALRHLCYMFACFDQ